MTRLELAIFGTGNRRLTIRPHHRVWIVLDFNAIQNLMIVTLCRTSKLQYNPESVDTDCGNWMGSICILIVMESTVMLRIWLNLTKQEYHDLLD